MATATAWDKKRFSSSKYQSRKRQLAMDYGGELSRKDAKKQLISELAQRASFQIANETLATKTVKFTDTTLIMTTAGATLSTGWTFIGATFMTIPLVLAGTTINQRTGNQVRVRHLVQSFTARTIETSPNNDSPYIRVVTFLDKQTNQNSPALTGTMLFASGSVGLVTDQFNMDNIKRFSILYDKTYTFNKTGTAAGFSPHEMHQDGWEVPLDFVATYTEGAEAGVITDQTTNRINTVLFVSSNQTLGEFDMTTRILWEDAQS